MMEHPSDPSAVPANADALADGAPQSARLGVQAAGEHWLIRLEDAAEVVAPGAVTPVPLTQAWFRGLTNIRGNLFSVIDFSAFLGGRPTPAGADVRLVMISDRYHMSAGLLVERMLGLRTAQQLQAIVPSVVDKARPWTSACYRDAEGRTWREISMAELVYQNEFLNVGL
jgi:twitching motility protein PilI